MTAGQSCAACGAALRPGVRFCTSCGGSLAVACPSCGATAEPGERFCGQCGTALAWSPSAAPPAPRLARAQQEAERKQVTVLFADVARSMDLAERLEAEEWTAVVQRLIAVCRSAVERFGGTVDKFTGDGVMALFGAPVAQEDHAHRACHAALAVLDGAAAYAEELRASGVELAVRVGLNSGEVVAGAVGGTGYTAVGHTVGLAQRMEALATPGSACLTAGTALLLGGSFALRDLGRVPVKGSAAPVGAYALGPPFGGARRVLGSARFVGRAAELAALEALLTSAQEGHAQVVGVVAEAGAGKSRLCEELALRAAGLGLTVRRTAGVSHAQDAPLLPIRGLLRDYCGITEAEPPASAREKVAGRFLGLDAALVDDLPLVFDFMEMPDPDRPAPVIGPEARQRRVLEVFRRATQRRSESDTLVLILEDLHWFDPHSVAFLEAWLPSFPGTRTLVVTNFRPEFQPPWARHSYYRQLPLAPLDGRAVNELLAELLGQDPDPELDLLTRQVRSRTGGNPFFIEEIVRALVGEGTLEGEAGAYRLVRSAGEVRVPSTVQGVLAARIDRLAVRDKALLQAAAVIGRAFPAAVLGPVADLPPGELRDGLDTLCREEMLQLTERVEEYRFWHPLTQEVAYSTLLAPARRRLHRAVAETLETVAPDRAEEQAAIIAIHYEAAGERAAAAGWQLRAGTRTMRGDFAEARRRWLAVLEHLAGLPETEETLALGVRARTLLLRLGARMGMDDGEARRLFAEAQPAADRLGDPRLVAGLRNADGVRRIFAGELATALDSWLVSRGLAEAAGDRELRAYTWTITGLAKANTGPLHEARRWLRTGRDLCDGDPSSGLAVAGYSTMDVGFLLEAFVCLAGGDLDDAAALLERAAGCYAERRVAEFQCWLLAAKVTLADWRGEQPGAASLAAVAEESIRWAEESGNLGAAAKAHQAAGVVALLHGRPADAAAILADTLARARKHRAGLWEEATLLAHLARAEAARGEAAAAREAADEAVVVARRQGAPVIECLTHAIRARVLRAAAASDADLTESRASVAAGEALAADVGAGTYAAFLAEERARLDGGSLATIAETYDAIGATGHARRIRAESGL